MKPVRQKFFEYFLNEHNLITLESDFNEIQNIMREQTQLTQDDMVDLPYAHKIKKPEVQFDPSTEQTQGDAKEEDIDREFYEASKRLIANSPSKTYALIKQSELQFLRDQLAQRDEWIANFEGEQIVVLKKNSEIKDLRDQLAAKEKECETLAEAYQSIGEQWDKSENEIEELKEALRELHPMAERHYEFIASFKGWIEGDPNEEIPNWYAKLPGYEKSLDKARKLIDPPNEKPNFPKSDMFDHGAY